MSMGGHLAAAAKNRRPDRTGYSARVRVFGRDERWPGSVVDAVEDAENVAKLYGIVSDPVAGRAWTMRSAAQSALVRMDADQRWRRALASGPRGADDDKDWQPGAQVFYWKTAGSKTMKPRGARVHTRWHGPAYALGKHRGRNRDESNQDYWVAHGSKLLLVAGQHLRAATREEILGNRVMTQVITQMSQALEDQRDQVRSKIFDHLKIKVRK